MAAMRGCSACKPRPIPVRTCCRKISSSTSPRPREAEPLMSEWIYFIHPPRENFAATMTDQESEVWRIHFVRLKRLLRDGVLVMAGPTLGTVNTGLVIIDAADEAAARQLMNEDPVIAGGYARGELRPLRVSLLRGRDRPPLAD